MNKDEFSSWWYSDGEFFEQLRVDAEKEAEANRIPQQDDDAIAEMEAKEEYLLIEMEAKEEGYDWDYPGDVECDD